VKIFWSWQSDTPGKIGRHFVRDVLNEAIAELKQAPDVEEPPEREAREALHLDHDRESVPGSPDLARMIFDKIERAAVFVADVTLVGQTSDASKKLINSNVAIEYGHAHHALGDTSILMVQNLHYGDREALPFDLKHKSGPIQFTLSPTASKTDIAKEATRLKRVLVGALRPYISGSTAKYVEPFVEIPTTLNPAIYFNQHEILCRVGAGTIDEIEYRFDGSQAFYLRLIPTRPLDAPLKIADLVDLVNSRKVDALARVRYSTMPDRNRFGAITFEPHGTATSPRSFTQTFTNGELWAVTNEFFVHRGEQLLIPTNNVQNISGRVLENFCLIAENLFGMAPPYTIELGAVGLTGAALGVGMDHISQPIHADDLRLRKVLNDTTADAQAALINEFLDLLFDLAGERRSGSSVR
jgi:hypothetical protein